MNYRPSSAVVAQQQYPLSDFQQSLWAIDQLNEGDPSLHMGAVLRAGPGLDLERFRHALRQVTRRHPALRAHLDISSGTPTLVVEPDVLPTLTSHGDSETAARSDSVVSAELLALASAPFDLIGGPLVRAHCLIHERGYDILLVVHHVVADGLSLPVVMKDLAAFYEDPSVQTAVEDLPPVPTANPDDVEWWVQQLAGSSTGARLPSDTPSSTGPQSADRIGHLLDRTTADRVASVARETGASVFAIHLATLSLLTSRLADAERPIIGVPFSGRDRTNRQAVGCYITTLPLACDPDPDLTARQFITRTGDSLWDALEHPEASFDAVARQLRRIGATVPQVQVLLNMVPFDLAGFRLGDVDVEVEELDTLAAKFDITLYVRDLPDEKGLLRNMAFVYNSQRWSPGRAATVVEQYQSILGQLIADTDRPLSAMTLPPARLPQGEGSLPVPRQPVVAQVLDNCERRPDRIAMREADETVTYRGLAERVRAVAVMLGQGGVGPGGLVALHGGRGVGLPVGLLASWLVGAGVVVLPRDEPANRLIHMTEASSPSALLITDAGVEPGPELRELAFDRNIPVAWLSDAMDSAAGELVPTRPIPEPEVATVTFTSGSTGHPMPVAAGPDPLNAFLPWYIEQFELDDRDRIGWMSAPGHDPALRDMLAPLVVGTSLEILPDHMTLLPGDLANWLMESEITVANLVPGLVQVLGAEFSGRTAPALRLLCFGGEQLTRKHVELVRSFAPNAEIVNFYGTTETPQVVVYQRVSAERVDANPPLGVPRPDVTIDIVNGHGHPVGVGELGELIIRTPLLSSGYLGMPTATAATFEMADGGVGACRTGDQVRVGPDATIEFVGRRDRQIQLNGNRIEPTEVESVLASFPGVADAVVCRQEGPTGGRLVAFLSRSPGHEASTLDVLNHAAGRVPQWMVPGSVQWVDEFPRLGNGKIDLRAVCAQRARFNPSRNYVAPLTPTELRLAAIWQEVLGGPPVGREDDFFTVGGHSVASMVVVNRIRDEFGPDIQVRIMFEIPVLKDLAEKIDASPVDSSGSMMSRQRAIVDLDALLADLVDQEVTDS